MTTELIANMPWNAEIIKKPGVELNIFASSDALEFKWDISHKRFTGASNKLTVQAGSRMGASAYKITAQLISQKLNHQSGAEAGSVDVSAWLGGVAIGTLPTDILTGNAEGATAAALGMQAINMAAAGPVETPLGSYSESDGVVVEFKAETGTGPGGVRLKLGGVSDGLELLTDGAYTGVVEMAFVASWTTP
ncbi:MAG: hypothetical protein ACRCU9_03965 [Iodobacter sp.]